MIIIFSVDVMGGFTFQIREDFNDYTIAATSLPDIKGQSLSSYEGEIISSKPNQYQSGPKPLVEFLDKRRRKLNPFQGITKPHIYSHGINTYVLSRWHITSNKILLAVKRLLEKKTNGYYETTYEKLFEELDYCRPKDHNIWPKSSAELKNLLHELRNTFLKMNILIDPIPCNTGGSYVRLFLDKTSMH